MALIPRHLQREEGVQALTNQICDEVERKVMMLYGMPGRSVAQQISDALRAMLEEVSPL